MAKAMRTAEAKLELELDADAPAGALVGADGRRRAFTGWIELAAAIEDWRQAANGDAPRARPAPARRPKSGASR